MDWELPLACPHCHRSGIRANGTWICSDHGTIGYVRADGIIDAMQADDVALHAQFLAEYHRLRFVEGRGGRGEDWLNRLPDVPRGDPFESEWDQRRQSMKILFHVLAAAGFDTGSTILDAGAGNCWLAHRLAMKGMRVVALDVNDDAYDGLGSASGETTGSGRVARVRASFNSLPLIGESVDCVVFNGSLHYSVNRAATLREATRVLRRRGLVVVVDSPVYLDAASGERMVQERGEGRSGFITRAEINELALTLRLDYRLHARRRSLATRLARLAREFRLGREIASMPVVEFRCRV